MSSRRFFLKSTGLAVVGFSAVPGVFVRAAQATDAARRKRTLVVVLQRGANDALNTVVPFGDPDYSRLRPNLAIAAPGQREGAALDLDGHFGLHPALEPLLPLWQEKTLAIVHAVGSPDPTRSHFDAQDFLESGTPGRKGTDDGWMNRQLQSSPDPKATPLRAVSVTPTLPRALSGRAPAVALPDLSSFDLHSAPGGWAARSFEGMYDAAVKDALGSTGRETFEAIETVRSMQAPRSPRGRRGERGGPRRRASSFGSDLAQVAALVKADVGLELAFVESTGWDTHAAQGTATGQHSQRLRELASGLSQFRTDLGDRFEDVAVVVLTEFGRTAAENGNRGTDHGHGSVALVLGGRVRGGRCFGSWPGLSRDRLYEGRDLAVTTDFRDLLSDLLRSHLGATDLSSVFPGYSPRPLSLLG